MASSLLSGLRAAYVFDFSCGVHRYVKFDTFHPAVEKGLPVTRVISRVTLQQILASACIRAAGDGVILNDCRVVDYEETVRLSRSGLWHQCYMQEYPQQLSCLHQPAWLLSAAGPDFLAMQVNAKGHKKVAAILDDGRRFEGDLLIGADGIWSKVEHGACLCLQTVQCRLVSSS
jgi:zeaxanthin epoxidase